MAQGELVSELLSARKHAIARLPTSRPNITGDHHRRHPHRSQTEVLKHASLDRVYEGLNSLGKLPWRVNNSVLDITEDAWNQKLAIADLPSQVDRLLLNVFFWGGGADYRGIWF